MVDRPILFSGPMVKALLDGRKTQTRRILKPQPDAGFEPWQAEGGEWFLSGMTDHSPLTVRFTKGDRLWVRETLRRRPANSVLGETWLYSADQEVVNLRRGDPRIPDMIAWAHHKEGNTCVSIHMPRWASRLTLMVTDVRVERLQEISEADCIAEGIQGIAVVGGNAWRDYSGGDGFNVLDPGCPARRSYRSLWDYINGAGAWDTNPWIVALTFTVERRNIHAVTRAAA